MLKITAIFIAASCAICVISHAYAGDPVQVEQSGKYIPAYGKALSDYNKKIRANGGSHASQAERQRIYDEAFAAAKDAYAADQKALQKRIGDLEAIIQSEIALARGGHAVKPSSPDPVVSPQQPLAAAEKNADSQRQPSSERVSNTGEVGKSGGADSVNFKARSGEIIPGLQGGNAAGAETVSFGSKK